MEIERGAVYLFLAAWFLMRISVLFMQVLKNLPDVLESFFFFYSSKDCFFAFLHPVFM